MDQHVLHVDSKHPYIYIWTYIYVNIYIYIIHVPRTAPGRASEWVDPGRSKLASQNPRLMGSDPQWIYSDL